MMNAAPTHRDRGAQHSGYSTTAPWHMHAPPRDVRVHHAWACATAPALGQRSSPVAAPSSVGSARASATPTSVASSAAKAAQAASSSSSSRSRKVDVTMPWSERLHSSASGHRPASRQDGVSHEPLTWRSVARVSWSQTRSPPCKRTSAREKRSHHSLESIVPSPSTSQDETSSEISTGVSVASRAPEPNPSWRRAVLKPSVSTDPRTPARPEKRSHACFGPAKPRRISSSAISEKTISVQSTTGSRGSDGFCSHM
mmetsp:Transcript_18492/g.50129  ORF Transcript_18492/g.50129 Transcript_18492/m.50129 type:complete len:256 (-) Transcript_18492:891-1658(-)